MNETSKPEVFIIESLGLDDEDQDLMEGQRIRDMLKMSNKKVKYFYIRTRIELELVMKEFKSSNYRYLHISCHGGKKKGKMGLWTTIDHLDFQTLGKILNPYLDRRRVFVSACEAATMSLAATLMTTTKCYSVMGPYNKTLFRDAPIFWTSFYHAMFSVNNESMVKEDIIKIGTDASRLFQQRIRLFTRLDGTIRPHDLR